jgi:hypothetical protein
MARTAWIASVATLLIATLALLACGDDNTEKNRYLEELTAAQMRFQTDQEQLEADATRSNSVQANRRALNRFADAIEDTITALRRIDVPPEVAAEHRRFVGVFVTWRSDVERFVGALKDATPASFKLARRRIAAATMTFNERSREAATKIDAKLAA